MQSWSFNTFRGLDVEVHAGKGRAPGYLLQRHAYSSCSPHNAKSMCPAGHQSYTWQQAH